MRIKVLRDYNIFILAVITFLNSCQLTTTGEKKPVLGEDISSEYTEQTNEKGDSVEVSKKLDQKFEPAKTDSIFEKEDLLKRPSENISSAQKVKDEKRILDFFSDLFKSDEEIDNKSEKKEIEKNDFKKKKSIVLNDEKVNTLKRDDSEIFKQEKPKDEKRILDFFTKFFETKNQRTENEIIDKESEVKNVEITGEKLNNTEKPRQVLEETSGQDFMEIDEPKDVDYEKTNNFKKEVIIAEPKAPGSLKEIKIKKIFDEDVQNEERPTKSPLDEKLDDKPVVLDDIIKQDMIEETNELAFLDTRKSIYKKRKRSNNLIGLLLPLTGEKRSAGNLVLNTFRYSLVSNPKDIIFKIYDTKGTSYGAVEAAKKGKSDNVDTFIGPVFSDETFAVKNAFKGDRKVKFFSLSPDLTNISKNVIVSGQNPKDQISCILDDIESKELKKVLLIHHNDKYGEVVKKNLEEGIYKFDMISKIDLSFFTVYPGQNLNKDIMAISNFESRKLALKEKRRFIENDKSLTKFERKNELKKLERQLTLGVPFDSIIVASDGDRLTEILSHLAFYDINANNTFIYGTSLWEDTNKKDKVFENTYFVSNLKSKESSFLKNYKDVFSRDPSSVSFHLFDLIDLVNDSKFYDTYPEDKIFFGEYTNSLLKSGYVKRETFIKQNRAGKSKNVFSCQLDEI